MIVNLPLRVLIIGTVIVAVVVAAVVTLTITGYSEAAVTLPIVVGTLLPVLWRQEQLSNAVAEHNANVTDALNGGLKAAVEQSVTKVITKMAAQDEAGQTTTVAKAATAITGTDVPPPPPLSVPDRPTS